MASWLAVGRHVGLASLAGLVSGIVVGGLLGRVVMRVSGFAAGPNMVGVRTSNGNRVGDITVEGTLALIVFTGLAAGLFGGVMYAVVEPWLRRLRPWHGLAYGVGLLATFGYTVLDPFNFDFTRFGPLALNIAMFAGLFIIFGVFAAWIFDRLGVVAARAGPSGRAVEMLAWLALGLASLLLVGVIATTEPDDLIFVLGTGAALALAVIVYWRGLPRAIGYACLAGVLVLGTLRTLDGLQLFRGF